MTNALTATKPAALARFGSEEDIKMLMERQASIFGIERSEVNRPDVQASLIKATQYSITYGYLPGIHIHMMPFNKKGKGSNGQDEWIKSYEPALGEKAWKDSADRMSQMQGFKYLVETQEMTEVEVRTFTAADKTAEYTPGDAGFKARVLRSDHAGIYKMMGRTYEPEWSYGFWRQKAKKNFKGQWISDETPNQRGPRDVAERRAYKAALMKVFSLVPLNEFDEARNFQRLSSHVEIETTTETALPAAPASVHYDEDGLLLWGEAPAEDAVFRTVDADTGEIVEPDPEPKPQAISNAQITRINTLGRTCFTAEQWNATKRADSVKWKTGNRTNDINQMTADEADELVRALERKANAEAAKVQSAPPAANSLNHEDAALWQKDKPVTEGAKDIPF